ncbi:MAG: DUF1360 domain-containing protein [Bacteroidales bacterium]|nr:DUF1360 domain-containing protein [Bacteroidales bacterium]
MFKSEYFWNFVYTIIFLIITFLIANFLIQNAFLIQQLSVFEFIVLTLAAYRLTRLLVYDKVLNFIRDGIKNSNSENGFIKSSQYFLTCPWCAGIWMSLFISAFYLYCDLGKFFAYILAISGVASFIHITITLLGWVAEERKYTLKKIKKEDKLSRDKSTC